MPDTRKHYRKCNLCKREYKYCGNCQEYNYLPKYMLAWCSENCKDIDGILTNWGAGIMDSDTAKTLLKAKDVSRKEFWNNSYQDAYRKIVGESKKEKKEEPKKEVKLEMRVEEKSPKTLSVSEEVKQVEEKKGNKRVQKPIAKEIVKKEV